MDIFTNLTIAVTGDFGQKRSHAKMQNWINFAGGTFVPSIDWKVTHLVASKADYKNNATKVRRARRVHGLHIVNLDWLEDSLLEERAVEEKDYLWQRKVKLAAEAKASKKARAADAREREEKAVQDFHANCTEIAFDTYNINFHLYQRPVTFPHSITLARINLTSNQNSRYDLKLLETHGEPVYFGCYAKYTSPTKTTNLILCPLGCSYETAFGAWKRFFKEMTGGEWGADPSDKDPNEKGEGFVYIP